MSKLLLEINDKLCEIIDRVVDENMHLGAGDIAHAIMEEYLNEKIAEIQKLERMVDSAHNAIVKTIESGCINDEEIIKELRLGLDQLPIESKTAT